ncbi:MAG: hypothetical protein WBC51_28010 [Vicinamibacterales bacterium]
MLFVLFAAVLICVLVPQEAAALQQKASTQLKIFLDCQGCFSDFMRTEITFVDFVRDRTEADVHVLVTSAETGGGGREYTVAFIGNGTLKGTDHTLKTLTTRADPEDIVRRQLATTLRIGLLNYIARDDVPKGLAVSVRLGSEEQRPAVAGDRWNNWVFSVRGSASFDGQESSREKQIGGSISADRITPDWKITFGSEFDHETEEFDLDEDEPVRVRRRERDFEWLAVKGLGEHWSIGGTGAIESSTFNNTELLFSVAPAVEYNVFPYSSYTRRQLRAQYAVGVRQVNYYEETLFGKMQETLPQHELSLTYEQREQWGSLEARTEWSQYLHELDKSRLELDGELAVRLARGLSVAADLNASRIRDQLGLPARGATPEEVLLRLRRLRSSYEYRFSMSLTYTFGSIFSSVVNPRFGE